MNLDHHRSESESDTELQNSFTTIEFDSAHITIHHTPVSRSSSAVEIKITNDETVSEHNDFSDHESEIISLELCHLPMSKDKLQEFLANERRFDFESLQ